ncbi:MAG: dCTP deaminase [Thermoplasmata archaeon M8B2D]|nr:MAG: dCTP deaminase [Thermoplasmata archaeon M8B2D]
MSILSDIDIKNSIEKNELGIEPFIEKNLTPNGYDLSIDEVFIRKTNEHIKEGIAKIPAQTWFAISTKEFVKMGPKVTSQLWIRSSYARKGVMVSFGKVDAGFHGTLTISCFNSNDEILEIPIGDRFCQIVFENMQSVPSELYDKKSGNYQNQRGIKLKK